MSDHHQNSPEEKPQNGEQLALVPVISCPQPLQSSASPQTQDLVLHIPSHGTTTGYKAYPPALAKHQEVVANGDLFLETLNKFHGALGTRFMVPTIGGKELDLHTLYVEVTSRGGLEQVIKDRKWKDVTGVFNFPPTATNASFVLRKYYISLLHHYERVYFFGAQGQPVPPPTPLPAPSPVSHTVVNDSPHPAGDEVQPVLKKRKRNVATPIVEGSLLPADPTSSVGKPVTGVIDGKFDHGYLVTVTVGLEKFRGVLYHMPTGVSGEQFAQVQGYMHNDPAASGVRPRRRRRRKDEMKKRDPDHPKPNRSGYNFFFAEQHARLKTLNPGKDKEISKMIGDLWSNLIEEEKLVYQERGLKDKERYKSEMQEYRERLNKVQAQNQRAMVATNEGLKPDPCEHQPGNHNSLEVETKDTGFKMAQLSCKSVSTDNISIKQEPSIQNKESEQ